MNPRLQLVVAVALAIIGAGRPATAQDSIRVGYAISKTGPNVFGAYTLILPNYQLWVHDVNAAGGLMLSSKGKRLPIEVIEYDDGSTLEGAVKAVERLISEDKVDFILAPWGTRLNLAVAPSLRRAGYPHLTATSMAPDDTPLEDMTKIWPSSFWFNGPKTKGPECLLEVLAKLRTAKKIGSTVAIINVADKFGIESSALSREMLRNAEFDIVYDRSYPLGTNQIRPVIQEAAATNPDVFLAFSYPADTMAVVEEARNLNFQPKVLYAQVGTAFPAFLKRFGKDAEGIMGAGGWNPDLPASKAYRQHHTEVLGKEPDRWASPLTYASLQMLQQAIERVGRIDRPAVIKELQTGTFETILGPIQMKNNTYLDGWFVGQWQGDEYYGIAPLKAAGAREPIVPKPAWHRP